MRSGSTDALPFSDATRTWFQRQIGEPTEVQRRGWASIASGAHSLLLAPTGSGKTLAAFLYGIDRLSALPAEADDGVRVLYVSPLKALVYDIERNLRQPLNGIMAMDAAERALRVDVRTGDTTQQQRRTQKRHPAEILVTTPESLFLILTSAARETLRTVETVIVDEIHVMANSKRGTHLALSLERLSALAERDPQRIGLSATVRPPDDVAKFLAGDRPVNIVDTSAPPRLDLKVVVPVPDMTRVDAASPSRSLGPASSPGRHESEELVEDGEKGIWAAIYPKLIELIRANTSTLIFVNTRGLCERLTRRLNDFAGEELVQAHHGSVSHERRKWIETQLKEGVLPAIVCTSSLELGIDMGAIDLVINIESPGAVSRGLQRVGRAGHQVGAESVGRIFPKFRGDLLEAAAVAKGMVEGALEPLHVPRNVLDVLAQQLVAMCALEDQSVDSLYATVSRAHPYRDLPRDGFLAVLDMLSGRYPSNELADLRPRLSWDRERNELRARKGARMTTLLNAGTIPDRGLFRVQLGPGGPRVGELDEEMVYESKPGDTFALGASTWKVEEITHDRVIVSPAPGEMGRLPFWRGDGVGRPVALGAQQGALLRDISTRAREEAID
ncbi:MAG: DEAD/DEAH box helicase, partial [Myxococcota bacterium]